MDTIVLLESNGYPDRLAPLFYCVSMSDVALVVVEAIDARLGECMVMLHCAGVRRGYIVLRNHLTMEQLAPLTKGTVMEEYVQIEDDTTIIRERLLEDARTCIRPMEGPGAVPVDHHFNVKGVGMVVLGMVVQGTIQRHDVLRALPTERTALVRSIQKHDDDFDEAEVGDREGLALGNIPTDELDRGFVLSADLDLRCSTSLSGTVELVEFWKHPLREGMVLHVGHWMQFVPARVTAVGDGSASMSLEKPLVHPAGGRGVLMYLDGGRLRVAGWMTLP